MPEHRTSLGTWGSPATRNQRIRKTTALLLAAGLMLGAAPLAATAAPAHSAVSVVAAKKVIKPSVSIGVIPTKSVTAGKKTTIKPALVKKGTTQVKSALLTVTAGKKTIAKNKTSATLGAGTYKVKTKIAYRVKSGKKWSATKTGIRTQNLVIKSVKASAKVNTLAGKKELVSRINAKRKANKLPPLLLVNASAQPSSSVLFGVGYGFWNSYHYVGSNWPTAKDWIELDGTADRLEPRLYTEKKATRISISNSSFMHSISRKKNNSITMAVSTNPPKASATPPKATVNDLSKPDARNRIIAGIQKMRSDAKLPALTVSKGEPAVKDTQLIAGSSGINHPKGSSVKSFLEDSSLREFARDRSATHLSVTITKKGSSYDVDASLYQVATR